MSKGEVYDVVEASKSMGATFNGPWISVGELRGYSLDVVWAGGGSPVGTFKLQWTNDTSVGGQYDVSGSSFSVSADGSNGWESIDPRHKFVRVVYTRTSGTATISCAKMYQKGG